MARLEEIFPQEASVTTTARFHLAAALAWSSERKAGLALVRGDQPVTDRRQSGGTLSSPVREAASMLNVLLDLDPVSPLIPVLLRKIRSRMHLGRWGTTQDNAWALLSLGKAIRMEGVDAEGRVRKGVDARGTVRVTLPNGSVREAKVEEGLQISGIKPDKPVRIEMEGQGKVYVYWDTVGVPLEGTVAEKDAGLKIRRTFHNRDGLHREVIGDFKQGEVYEVHIELWSEGSLENIVVADLLPAGFEIIKARLVPSTGESDFSKGFGVLCVEPRDDRLLVFGELDASGHGEFRYLVRAVTPGTFSLPASDASCMYDPGIFSLAGSGIVRIKH
jgi:uncharacterized protein YfaS (alpha-2-macroglobulin family)